jgi:hypothetical protein
LYQVLAWISRNNHTGCEQCTWITMWIATTGNCWSRVYWLAFGKYWGSAVSENCHLEEDNDKGEVWVRKTVLHLWMFTHEMWEQQNSVLQISSSSPQGECRRLILIMRSKCGRKGWYLFSRGPMVFWYPIGNQAMQATKVKAKMASECKNFGG